MRLVVPERWMIRWSCASTGSISGSVAAAVTILSAKVLSLPVAVAVAGRVARGPPRGVVLCDRLLVDAGDRDGLLGVGAVVGGEGRLHPRHVVLLGEVQLRDLLQAAGRALLHAYQAALAVLGADRVVPVLARVPHHADVRADDVAVVAAVADPAAHAPVRLGHRQ